MRHESNKRHFALAAIALGMLASSLFAAGSACSEEIIKLPNKMSEFNGWQGVTINKISSKYCKLNFPKDFGLQNSSQIMILRAIVYNSGYIKNDVDCVLQINYDALNQILYLATERQDAKAASMLLDWKSGASLNLDGEAQAEYAGNYELPVLEKFNNLPLIINKALEEDIADSVCHWAVPRNKLDRIRKLIEHLQQKKMKRLTYLVSKRCKFNVWGSWYYHYDVTSSKPIENVKRSSYETDNLRDGDVNSAWCSRLHNSKTIWFNINYFEPTKLSGIGFVNGYARNSTVYKNNARPKSILVYVDEKLLTKIVLADISEPQWINFIKSMYGMNYRFHIEEIYDGAKYLDLCITEVFDKRDIVSGYNRLTKLDEEFANRALTVLEIKKHLRPLYRDLYNPGRNETDSFWEAISLRASKLDERGLRLILDLIVDYYSVNKSKLLFDDRFIDGLRNMIMPFFVNSQDVVIHVLNDEKQSGRENISHMYRRYLTLFGYNEQDQNRLRMHVENFTLKHEQPIKWSPFRNIENQGNL